jgi:DNA polymerase V
MLGELVSANQVQSDFFYKKNFEASSEKLMGVLDSINKKMGRGTMKLASEGFKQPWRMKQGNKSPNYTTQWTDIPSVL